MQDAAGPQRPTTLLPELERLLATRPAHVADAVRRVVTDVRPCVRLESTRITNVPLRGRWIDRIRRRPPPEPKLTATASKFGGIPYAETADALDGVRFIGQINFAEVSQALEAQKFPTPSGMPSAGLLALDLIPNELYGRVRWYPDPRETKAVRPTSMQSVAKHEAQIRFRGSWSMQGLEWFDAVPRHDDELWTYMSELQVPQVDEDAAGGHKLFGHPNEALNEHYGLRPRPGRSDSIKDYALIWRLDYDNAAGFAWGTNWLYVVIHQDDLAKGTFENAIVTGANA